MHILLCSCGSPLCGQRVHLRQLIGCAIAAFVQARRNEIRLAYLHHGRRAVNTNCERECVCGCGVCVILFVCDSSSALSAM